MRQDGASLMRSGRGWKEHSRILLKEGSSGIRPSRRRIFRLRKLSALEALSRSGKAEVKLLSSISIEPNLWPTSAVIDWLNILQNMSGMPNREERRKEAEQILRSRLNFQGTKMGFSTEGSDCLWWLMVSNDVNAVRVILSLLHSEEWKEDMPRLVQGALARQNRGRWDLTLANAWGVLAMEKFSKAFEAVPVTGSTRANLSTQSQTTDWSTLPQRESLSVFLACKERRTFHHSSGRRKTVGNDPEPCRHPPERAFLKRIQDQKDRHPH